MVSLTTLGQRAVDYLRQHPDIRLTRIGSGCYGKVYRLDLPNNDRVALKLFTCPLSNDVRDYLDTVIRIFLGIDLPHVMGVHGICDLVWGRQEYKVLILDYVSGKNLDRLHTKIECTDRFLLPLFKQVLIAIAALHERQIVHRDIKPANIVYSSKTNSIKLVDLEFASQKNPESSTVIGVRGSPVYISPEVFEIIKNSLRSNSKMSTQPIEFSRLMTGDVWAIGVTFFYILYGCEPFDGSSWNEIAVSVLENHWLVFPSYPKIETPKINQLIDECMKPANVRLSAKEMLDKYFK